MILLADPPVPASSPTAALAEAQAYAEAQAQAVPPRHFEALYAGSDDPWHFDGSWYEARKRHLLLAALPHERYGRAFEPGCATGLLTAELAPRCGELLATDGAERALEVAGRRLEGHAHVALRRMWVPDEWPEGAFDLVVLSEFVYYLAPADAPAQRRPYVLLLRAMQEANVAAIGKFVLWGKENLCLIRPLGESLALETLYYAEDIRTRAEIDEAVGETEVAEPELEMARQLVSSLVGEFEPEEFVNEYRGELRAMLEAKLAGEEIVAPEQPEPAKVVDLMEALKESVAQAQKSKAAPAAKKKPAARKKRAASGSR